MSTSGKTLIAPTSIYNELIEAEEKAIAALGLLEDVIQPAFEDLRQHRTKEKCDIIKSWISR